MAGLLAIREDPEHEAAHAGATIAPIDLLVVNLYPFEATVAQAGARLRRMHREHRHRRPGDDPRGREEPWRCRRRRRSRRITSACSPRSRTGADDDSSLRRALAQKAYARTAAYDAAICELVRRRVRRGRARLPRLGGRLAECCATARTRIRLRASTAPAETRFGVATARQVQGKQLSYNNINDTDAAFECVARIRRCAPPPAIIKHANPCGVAEGSILADAYREALACDPVSAFGGVVALNRRPKLRAAAPASSPK